MINLDDRDWKKFKIKDIGKIMQSKRYARRDRQRGDIPYVERSTNNNGVTDFISIRSNTPKSFYRNVIAVNASGAPCFAFYHPYKAYFADGVDVIKFKHLNWAVGLFIVTCIRQQHTQFNYGFELYDAQLKQLKINLPVNANNNPDWDFMANYIEMKMEQTLPSINFNFHAPHISLNTLSWKMFKIGDLFKIQRGKRIPKRSRHRGNIPFVGASTVNNGVTDNINTNGVKAGYHKNVIGVNYNGAPCYAFYHPYLAYFCDDVITLSKTNLNTLEALFITTCIREQKHQFGYGFKLRTDRLKQLKINLPVDKQGKPNWKFMNDYMKSMVSK